MLKDRTGDAIAQAVQALRVEELSLTEEISFLQNRLANVRAAFTSMRALLDTDADKDSNPAQSDLGLDTTETSGYEGLPFSKALHKFMSTVARPLFVREITDGMKAAGYRFNSDNETTQVYVGLKRNEHKLYMQAEANQWMTLELASSLKKKMANAS
ncbi:MAG: hypothetical protein V4542_18395 [Pseudomonadota bacterium]